MIVGQDGRQSIETLKRCGAVVVGGNPKHVMYFLLGCVRSLGWCGFRP